MGGERVIVIGVFLVILLVVVNGSFVVLFKICFI